MIAFGLLALEITLGLAVILVPAFVVAAALARVGRRPRATGVVVDLTGARPRSRQ